MLSVLVLATRNKHKVEELRALLNGVAEVHDLTEYPGIPEVDETGTTFTENAILKAEAVANYIGLAALTDDSGLEVDVLKGAPGVYSARYSGPEATDAGNRQKLLHELGQIPFEQRTGRFVCAVALAVPGKPTWTTTGIHEGLITFSEQGSGGFGYDSLFYSPELKATFGEVRAETKNKVSHRARALEHVRKYLLQENLV